MSNPTLGPIRRHAGIAGQIAYSVEVTYPDESPESVTFVGNISGGPVVMITSNGHQTFVTDSERFGKFGPSWVRRFFGQES